MKTIEQLRKELKNAEDLVRSINDEIYNHPWYFEKLIEFYKNYDFVIYFINQFEFIKYKDESYNEDYIQIFEFKLKNDHKKYLFTFSEYNYYFSIYQKDHFVYLENMPKHLLNKYENFIYNICEFSEEVLQQVCNEDIKHAIVLLCLIERA
jgi:hypothetical protein